MRLVLAILLLTGCSTYPKSQLVHEGSFTDAEMQSIADDVKSNKFNVVNP